MRERCKSWIDSAGGVSVLCRQALIWLAAAWFWFRPSNELSTALLWIAGIYALWNGRQTLAAWRNPVGIFFGLGVLWALLSTAWSFDPEGPRAICSKRRRWCWRCWRCR